MLYSRNISLTKRIVFFLLGVFMCSIYPAPAISGTLNNKNIRVCLSQNLQVQEFSVQGDYQLVDPEGMLYSRVKSGEVWQVEYADGELLFYKNGERVISGDNPVSLQQSKTAVTAVGSGSSKADLVLNKNVSAVSSEGKNKLGDTDSINIISKNGVSPVQSGGELNLVKLDSQRYRGDLEFRSQGSGIMVVNTLPMEEYLYGVVPGEMPSYWPLEALKAQAVAARTYALTRVNSVNANPYDVLPTTANQMYKGYNGEQASTNRAVNETRGQILEYRGKPIDALFHSCSGGYLESSQDVWQAKLDYLSAKPDPHDQNNVHYNWSVNYSQEQLVNQINKSLINQSDSDKIFATIEDVELLEMTSSEARVKRIKIVGTDASNEQKQIEFSNADKVRSVLGLKSSLFELDKVFDDNENLVQVVIKGCGYGHGLGMSQYGAYGMANEGHDYLDILNFYYNNVEIVNY